ncbi:DUF262 domain-containing protein [uncultured Clostridium sp.]|uniref:DUF262 domain-containing protein n=1 Tax=uncultured Clostridium sp. TaxID=59620 RepID=UPI00262605BC|nr:DUF262 domain-containing protein [uncultured Clostridium sp.]
MRYESISVKRVITYFNNPIEQGGFWLPNIEKEFVWREEQIEAIADSIMREYPIGTFLVLKTKKPINYRRFVNTYSEGVNINSNPEAITENQKLLVLDGQQRLQSLYIGLNGSYNGKELYFNVLSGYKSNDKGLKYDFKFMDDDEKEDYWVKVKEIINSDKKNNANRRNAIARIEKEAKEEFSQEIKNIIDDNLDKLINCFTVKEIVCFALLDDVDSDGLYNRNDICDIVTRHNSIGSVFNRDDLSKALT